MYSVCTHMEVQFERQVRAGLRLERSARRWRQTQSHLRARKLKLSGVLVRAGGLERLLPTRATALYHTSCTATEYNYNLYQFELIEEHGRRVV